MRADPFTLRDARPEDADWFAPRLRAADKAEVEALCFDPAASLCASIAMSLICKVAELDGRGVIILGCAEAAIGGETRGVPWLLATDEVTAYPGALTRIGKRYVAEFLERWPVLVNVVDERNTVSIRWLERLGFTMHEPTPAGLHGELFRPFTMGS